MIELLRRTVIVGVMLAVTPWNARAPAPNPLAASARPMPRDLAAGNLVVNPGFESTFELHGGPELSVGAGWTPWFDARKVRPEYKGERYEQVRPDGSISAQSFRVFHGAAIQKLFTSSSVHDAGVYQQVAVPPGARLVVSAHVLTWSSDCDDGCVSPTAPCRPGSPNSHGTYHVQVGLDPTGAVPLALGSLPPETVVWSPDVVFEAYADWTRVAIEATAGGSAVTVYLRGHPEWPVKHNDSYWDDVRLELVDGTPPAPTPSRVPPTTVPSATTRVPTASPVASATATAVPPGWTPPPPVPGRVLLPLVLDCLTCPLVPTRAPTGPPAGTPSIPPSPAPTAALPSPTPVPTDISPTPTSPPPTDSLPPTPTPPGRCLAPLENGDFEAGDARGWTLAPADGPARPAAEAETGPTGGDWSLRVGVPAGALDLGRTWSSAAQAVAVPPDVVTATVRFAVRPVSQEAGTGDWQMVTLRDADGLPLELLAWHPGVTAPAWSEVDVPLAVDLVAGRTVRFAAEVYNDGDGAPTMLFVDNVRLSACRAGGAGGAGGAGFAPVPPGADVRIDYPIRHHPGQSGFLLGPACADLPFESLIVRNNGTVTVDVDGWTLEGHAGDTFQFPPLALDPGDRVRVWTRSGEDVTDGSFADVYWNRSLPVWDDTADEAVIRDDQGTEVARRGYP